MKPTEKQFSRITRLRVLNHFQLVVFGVEFLHALSDVYLVIFHIRPNRYDALATAVTDLKR